MKLQPQCNPLILYFPVDELPIIEKLTLYEANGVENLEEILEFSAPDLLKTQGDTYLCLQELVSLTEKHNGVDLLRERD